MSLRFAAGLSACAAAGTIASSLPYLIALVADGGSHFDAAIFVIGLAAILNWLIGPPVSIDAYWGMRRRGKLSLKSALTAANLAGLLLAVLTYTLMASAGFIFYGVPTILAANAWAVCGWYLVARPRFENPRFE